jgi:hypothetical protein
VCICLLLLGGVVAWWFHSSGYTLYYGDAEAHLNIARRVVDSRTPGYDQIGTVWLPVPHLLMLPFASDDSLWRSGLAGVIPSVLCFALAGTALFATVRLLFDGIAPALCAVLLLALNPNVLYLQSIPMTEPVLLASLMGLLYFSLLFLKTKSTGAVLAAGFCSVAASLTRYEGWFLIPFVCLAFLIGGGDRRWRGAVLFGVIASAAPLYWLAHNWYFEGSALEFYNGPYSAKAYYQRALDAGMGRYPGDHDWAKAIQYYRTAAQLCSGAPLLWIGAAGIAAALWKRAWWAIALLALPPVFYVLSMYSSGTPIFVPTLWPSSYYNTRYGIVVMPLLVVAASALVAIAPSRFRGVVATVLVLVAVSPWIFYPRPDNWICWKESKVNSDARRAWTKEAAAVLAGNYRGGGIFFSFGDLTGVLREAGIPIRESLHEGNGPHALAAVHRPDLFLWEEWAIAIAADRTSQTILKTAKTGPRYMLVHTVTVKGAPPIEIYRRSHDNPIR